jgi:LPS-assembly lipoprotein
MPLLRARYLRLILLSLALLLLSACGFHLRGAMEFSADVSTVYIQADDRYSPFYRELVAVIRKNNLGPASNSSGADAIIRVLRDDTMRRTLSVSARNVPVEFEIYYVVQCAVIVHGEQIVEPHRFILTRSYTYDETKVLGKANEDVMLTNALAQNLVGQLMQAISAAR